MPQSCFFLFSFFVNTVSVAFTQCSHTVALAAVFRYTEFDSQRYMALLSLQTDCGCSSFLVCTVVAEITSETEQKQGKKGILRRKSRRRIPKAYRNSTPALHVSVYQRQADVRSCSVIKGTCYLTLVLLTCKATLSDEAALSCF